MKNSRLLLVLFLALMVLALAALLPGKVHPSVVINARGKAPEPAQFAFPVGGTSPDGHVLSANSLYLTMDGKPWFPLMGEFHYSRYPEAAWEREIQKMKAGGIQIVSTYVFWIHHEEVKGQFDWAGQRDLRRFVELCAKNGMFVWIRVGPWDHGEARNGGLPDWLVEKTPTRGNDPNYLDAVSRFFNEIGKHVHGQFWKDGGPIIGVQLENEYNARGPGKGADHILKLQELARSAGLDAPFYTITGWDNAVIPPRDVLPVFGGYADGFWWRSLDELPPVPNYFFTSIRCEEDVGDDLRSTRPDIDALDMAYPFLTAEMGGGMAVSYHRRPLLSPDDTAAMEVAKLGSGVVLYGYYMFHGGTNPDGKRTTLQESQATGYPNDLPVKSYDFQAPLGEFGQMNPSYRVLKTLNLFLGDFGSVLAPMAPYFPGVMPKSKLDTQTPRVAARFHEDRGFVFLNNYERTYRLAEQKNFQVRLQLPSGVVDVPRAPVRIPSGAYAIWPVNLDMHATRLRYATAQLLCKLEDPNTFVFFTWPGVAAEFAFEDDAGTSIESPRGRITQERGVTYVDQLQPGADVAIRIRRRDGSTATIVLLTREQALDTWKGNIAGRDRILLSSAQLYWDHDQLHALDVDPSTLKVGFFPDLDHPVPGLTPLGEGGVFKFYGAHPDRIQVSAQIQKTRDAGVDPPPKMGKEMMGKEEVLAPDESAFDGAAEWSIRVPCVEPAAGKVFLRIDYTGDVARLYSGSELLTDNFYNGTPWMVGLDEFPCREWSRLKLKILPLRNQAPIYLPQGARPAPSPDGQTVQLKQVQAIPEYEAIFDLKQ